LYQVPQQGIVVGWRPRRDCTRTRHLPHCCTDLMIIPWSTHPNLRAGLGTVQ